MLIDKPSGWTSHDVVAVVRRQLATRAVGHAGTLDPFATGLLVVLVGKATRLARFAEGMAKRYRAVVRFGTATDTDDLTGAVIASTVIDRWPDDATIAAAVQSFVGTYAQQPPAYSAKHVHGVRSHVLARRGDTVPLAAVDVTVHSVDVIGWNPPDLEIDVCVSRGTYLRSLARDLGTALGMPAHCAALRRTAIGPFRVELAVPPERVVDAQGLSLAALLPGMPAIAVDASDARELGFGRTIAQHGLATSPAALVADDGRLLAVAEARDARWHPVVVLEPA